MLEVQYQGNFKEKSLYIITNKTEKFFKIIKAFQKITLILKTTSTEKRGNIESLIIDLVVNRTNLIKN